MIRVIYVRGVSEPISARFADLRNDLISISRRSASLLLGCASLETTLNGPRPRVNFAPLPSSCSATRRSNSLVISVYSDPSEHPNI